MNQRDWAMLGAKEPAQKDEKMQAVTRLRHQDHGQTLAVVLAGGNGTRLRGLTRNRAKPAVPFGGHNRVVDYTLSNCVGSGIARIAVLTQYKAESLTRHLQYNWLAADDSHGGSLEIWPARPDKGCGWYAGTADAVYQNLDLIEAFNPDHVLVLAGDHVYEMDYSTIQSEHVASSADVTLSCVEVPASESREFGIVEIDDRHSLRGFIEKPDRITVGKSNAGTVLASMGIYLFSTDYMISCLEADARDTASHHDFGFNILPRLVGDASIHISIFRTADGNPGYWRDVGTIDSYWLAHRELLCREQCFGDGYGLLFGAVRPSAPARILPSATVTESLIGADCVIAGTVEGSVVSTGCRIDEQSTVIDSVLLPGVTVGRNCILNRAIIDSRCHIPDDYVVDARRMNAVEGIDVSPRGIALVTAEAMMIRAAEDKLRTA